MSRNYLVSVPAPADIKPPVCMEVEEFLGTDFPKPKDILCPIVQERGSLMIHGPTGCGKTYLTCGLVAAVVTGGNFLGYSNPSPKSVFYADFECQAALIQQRIAQGLESVGREPQARFTVMTPDLNYPSPAPNLSDESGRAAFDAAVDGHDVVVIDNISTAFRGLAENDSQSWQVFHDWVLRHRSQGRAMVVIQHEGKRAENGARGSSKQADILDSIVQLRRPAQAEEGALRFDVKVLKCRHHEVPPPFGARMEVIDGRAQWTMIDLKLSNKDLAKEMFQSGMTAPEIAIELGLSRSQGYRIKKDLGL